MRNTKSLSIVIPTYNGILLLKKYLPNIIQVAQDATIDYELIVVDDCSSDGTPDWLKENYPNVILLENRENFGFSHTINRGIFTAKNEIVLALNNDIRLPNSFFDNFHEYFIEENVFSISCSMMDATGTAILESAKIPECRISDIKILNLNAEKETISLYSCGGCAFYDRQKLIALKGFDELFSPFYYEDMDLCLRAWTKGWKTLYRPDNFCYHEHSATIKSISRQNYVMQIITRNMLFIKYLYSDSNSAFWRSTIYRFLRSVPLVLLYKKRNFCIGFVQFLFAYRKLVMRKKALKAYEKMNICDIEMLFSSLKHNLHE